MCLTVVSNRKVWQDLLKWGRYQGRCDKAARQITDVPGYGRALVSWYRLRKRKSQGLVSEKVQRREGL